MPSLLKLLKKERALEGWEAYCDYDVNVCDRDDLMDELRITNEELKRINKKIIKALKKELKERTNQKGKS